VQEAVLYEVSRARRERTTEPARERRAPALHPRRLFGTRREIERDQLAARIVLRELMVGVDLEVVEAPPTLERGLEILARRHLFRYFSKNASV
jgi:hypothetical protein